MKKKAYLEHITKFFYENKNNFKINTIKNNENYSKFNMCVDTVYDIRKARIIYKKIPHLSNRKISWKTIIEKYHEKNINGQWIEMQTTNAFNQNLKRIILRKAKDLDPET